ncbi:hypothetical protein CAEBREN_12804 [Caenorhabditis brenneri]|uniref:DDE-1 domain-containing protein n=1 Tax=Caenorhabditis brenneri TaxID=135651 RepID=G0NY63_CAEBE|nr:hypothetical protein CAEBREN_12804 [Caenorhabditis brenneri]
MQDKSWIPADEEYNNMKVYPDAVKAPGKPNMVQFQQGDFVELEKVKEAVKFYGHLKGHHNNGSQKRPSLPTMKSRFRFIKDDHHLQKLRDYEKNGMLKCNRMADLEFISQELEKEVRKQIEEGQIIHYATLRFFVSDIIKRNNILFENFKVSDIGLSSRKITKFVALVKHKDRALIEKESKKFVDGVNKTMRSYNPANIFNADQSGFQLEMTTARTLTFTGVKDVHCVVQNVSATTHSYTILPIISASGKLHEKLFVTLKEPKGKFLKKGHFKADNLVVTCHTSHIMTKNLMQEFFEKVVFDKSMPKKSLLMVDSWSSWKDKGLIDSITPRSKKLEMVIIPLGCTGHVQPCDVGIFGGFKKVVKTITSYCQLTCKNYKLCARDPTLKMISQVWWQLRSPKLVPWVRQAWAAAGYNVPKPPHWFTPRQLLFSRDLDRDCVKANCDFTPMIKCIYCERSFCFSCFFVKYHKCC